MTLSIRKIPDELLNDDLSNLQNIILPVLKKEIEKNPNLLKIIKSKMLEFARMGFGVPSSEVTNIFSQSGIECQTYALLNGAYIVAPDINIKTAKIANDTVDEIRSLTNEQGLNSLSMADVALNFKRVGIDLIESTRSNNPLKITKELFKERSFLGALNGRSWHATSIVPISDPTEEFFCIQLDSLGGTIKGLSLNEFLSLVLNIDYMKDDYKVYRVK